jgi:pimeloyl-ACP methyl ester carboxylesterase
MRGSHDLAFRPRQRRRLRRQRYPGHADIAGQEGLAGHAIALRVRPLLQAAGHDVLTPTLIGLGERCHLLTPAIDLDSHVQDVLDVLEYEDLEDVILVGHSYAGMVITGALAKPSKRIAQLVYLDAFLPEDGKALNDYVPAFIAGYEENVRKNGDGWRLPFAGSLTLAALGVTDPADVAWMTPRMCDQPYRTFTQPVRLPSGFAANVKRTYLLSSDRSFHVAAAKRAREQGFAMFHMPGAGHDVMVTQPQALLQSLLEVV